MDAAKRRYMRQRDELRREQYLACYANAVEALDKIDQMITQGTTVEAIRAVVSEAEVMDRSLYHVYQAEDRKMQNARAKELRAAKLSK